MVFFRGHLIGHNLVSTFDELLDGEEIGLKMSGMSKDEKGDVDEIYES